MRQGIYLAPRRLPWDFSAVPACPVAGDPDLAAFLVAISYFVVAFEDFGIPVVRTHLPRVADHRALEREARAFIAQEALHSTAHAQFNATMESRHGLRSQEIDREWARFRRDTMRGTPQEQLATVAAFEHVIYAVADWYEKAVTIHPVVDPAFHRLLLWHAMEETEHTAVVWDMYAHVYGDLRGAYRTRVEALVRVTRIAARAMLRAWHALLPQFAAIAQRKPSPSRSWKALVREAARYSGDVVGFLSPRFSPADKEPDVGLLPTLRRQIAPVAATAGTGWRTMRVAQLRDVSTDVRAFELVADNGASLPAWSAGAHVEVEIEAGIVRPYSLCGDPLDRSRYMIAVKREVLGRGGSLRMHEHVGAGSVVRVGTPRNHFPLAQGGSDAEALLVAGGIGVTPLLAMAQTLHAEGRPFTLHLCARDAAHLPFGAEMGAWPFRLRVRVHLDSELAPAAAGRVDPGELVPEWDACRPRTLYVCGPAPFVDAVRARAKAAGWPDGAVHTERFAHTGGPRDDDAAFTVHLRRSGTTLMVSPQQTIVEAMEAQALAPATSCREGVCGACVCRVLGGEVDHRDAVLSEQERRDGGHIAICVSRARGDQLTLDL